MKNESLRYIAVMDGSDMGKVIALKAVVKRLKGTVFKVEVKEVCGSVKTGVGIDIPSSGARNLIGMIDPCWTLYAKGPAPEDEEQAKDDEPRKKVEVKPKPKKPEPEDGEEEGCGTGDEELEEYLAELERRGCSDGEILLMVPSPNKSAKPNSGMKKEGYFCFTRGETPKGNPRLPKEVAK